MSSCPDIVVHREHEITAAVEEQLRILLDMCFPDTFGGRTYFKQLPHCRLLAFDEQIVVGQLGLDFRIINVGGVVVKILGIIDLCVHTERRRMGMGSKLLMKAEEIGRGSGSDFLVLVTDRHDFYKRHGFHRVRPAYTKWLAIEELQSVKLIERDLSDCFMVKPLGATQWPAGRIDLLGYLF